jgi:hypothetical protein
MSVITGDFSGGCNEGAITLTGTTNIEFSTNNCHIPLANDYLVRFPAYTFEAEGYTLTVSAPSSGGQKLMRTGVTSFEYSVLGVERVGKSPDGGTLLDIETTTGSPIQVAGLTRTGRTMTGGSLAVQHKLAGFTTTFVPNNLTWSSGCNCPTSGSLDATNSGSRNNAFTMTMGSGCGDATLAGHEADGGTLTLELHLDQCHAL